AIRQVASTPGAISYASSAIMLGQSSIRPIALSKNSETVPFSALKDDGTVNLQAFERNNYPITRQLYVVIRRDGTNNEKAGVAYANFLVSMEGQAMVRKAGFVPIYWEERE
ncbi:MAG: phosphate ABC transporter substrate-binding protein, partial [Xenococcaceae cyanobacterium MO_207.B15]|nr:phosphate ABC transporter substrate-binding protein [Xenococcaceae cyanobacterium MO_207.B15]